MFFDEEEFFPFNPIDSQKRARIVVQGSVYFIEKKPNNSKFLVSSHLYTGNKKRCFKAEKIFPFEEIEQKSTYIPFKNIMHNQAKVEEDWEDFLEDHLSNQIQ